MKLQLLLTTLLLSASPAVAEDLLYLKCDDTTVVSGVLNWPDGEKTTAKNEETETFVLKIDTRNKTMAYNNTEEKEVAIQDNEMSIEMIFKNEFEDENVKYAFVTTTMLSPPYTIQGEGKSILKGPVPGLINSVRKGRCIKINATEFDDFLNQLSL